MEFRHLQSFLAIVEELHFGRAAAKLHLTQPSLSQQLQRLERTLGVELVARTSHEVRLTQAGRAFETHARAIVAQVDRAALTAKEAAAGRTGTINVGFNYPAAQHILPATLAKMGADHPKVTVGLWEKRTGPQLTALAAGDLDVALIYGHPVSGDFRYRRLMRVPLVALVGPTHKWAGRPRVPFAELAHQSCVLFGRDQSPAMYDAILAAAQRSGITLDIAQVVDDSAATGIVVSVTSLVGFTSMSRGLSVGPAASGLRPVVVQLCDPVPTIDLHVVWRAGEDAPLVAAFLDRVEPARPSQAAPVRAEARVGR
ncbi:MAG TPA: LysR substrate-binding domain-containing protein [Pseudonocardiaceae bacterium]|jgi:DNA-binding transcriptional LysR family regulator|nr:LysR substrate-binding domain-containing protein [Pseudonocardiaceae bacterium]